jgi:hypothetical protein
VGAQASCKLGLSMNASWDSIHPVPQHHVVGSSTRRMTQSPRLESTHTGCKFLIVTHGAYFLYTILVSCLPTDRGGVQGPLRQGMVSLRGKFARVIDHGRRTCCTTF